MAVQPLTAAIGAATGEIEREAAAVKMAAATKGGAVKAAAGAGQGGQAVATANGGAAKVAAATSVEREAAAAKLAGMKVGTAKVATGGANQAAITGKAVAAKSAGAAGATQAKAAAGLAAGATGASMVPTVAASPIAAATSGSAILTGTGRVGHADLIGGLRRFALYLRGQAAGFSLNALCATAHRFDQYLADAPEVLPRRVWTDLERYIDAISELLATRGAEAQPDFALLPPKLASDLDEIEVRRVEVMLVAPHGAQAHFIERELRQCGYRTTVVAVITSLRPTSNILNLLPKKVPVIHKGTEFADDLFRALDNLFVI